MSVAAPCRHLGVGQRIYKSVARLRARRQPQLVARHRYLYAGTDHMEKDMITVTLNRQAQLPMAAGMAQKMGLEQEEDDASKQLFPELREHLKYANDLYNIAFKVQRSIGGRLLSDVPDLVRAHLMILMRSTDYLRGIQLLAIRGYPEQAGTLAASIFELAHTAMFFADSPERVKAWLEARSIKLEMPWGILGSNWKKSVKANCERLGDGTRTESEYQVYSQLCWMKHSLPKMQDLRLATDGVELLFGPYVDERAINHAWFALEHGGRLTEITVELLQDAFGSDETRRELREIAARRDALQRMAIERFGQHNLFTDESV
jgi:hypothetical protein